MKMGSADNRALLNPVQNLTPALAPVRVDAENIQ